jgi:probable F420-dependent oxidoreductase
MRNPFRFGYLAMQPGMSRSEWLDRARFAEGSGFSTFQQSDHFDRTPMAPLLTLAAVAQVTSTIRLGTLVLDNDFRHPAMLAKEVATLDVLSGGRLEFGLGAGWMTADYRTSGIQYDPPRVRIARLRESVEIITSVLGSDGPVSLATERFSVTEMQSVPAPTQRPYPPLLLGGGGKRMLSFAGARADIVSINMMLAEGRIGPRALQRARPDATLDKIGWVRAAAAHRIAVPPLHLICFWTAITDDPPDAAARKIASANLDTTPEELLKSPHCLMGPRSAVIERLHQLRDDFGFSYFTFYDSDADAVLDIVKELAGT